MSDKRPLGVGQAGRGWPVTVGPERPRPPFPRLGRASRAKALTPQATPARGGRGPTRALAKAVLAVSCAGAAKNRSRVVSSSCRSAETLDLGDDRLLAFELAPNRASLSLPLRHVA